MREVVECVFGRESADQDCGHKEPMFVRKHLYGKCGLEDNIQSLRLGQSKPNESYL